MYLLRPKFPIWPSILWKKRTPMRLWSSSVSLPPREAYGMAYVVTAERDSAVYLGVKVYIADHGDNKKEVHMTVHDREEEYPYHIVRYPEFGTVVPRQLGSVVMGRLVHCQERCRHMLDFMESIGNTFDRVVVSGAPLRDPRSSLLPKAARVVREEPRVRVVPQLVVVVVVQAAE